MYLRLQKAAPSSMDNQDRLLESKDVRMEWDVLDT